VNEYQQPATADACDASPLVSHLVGAGLWPI
jgi:hypothetical protein